MRKPVPVVVDPKGLKLDAWYQLCAGGCNRLFEVNELQLQTRVTDGAGICDDCANDSKKFKAFMRGIASVAALALMLVALPAHAQTATTTDHQTVCTTDANDVTVCTTAPNYAEEAQRAEAAQRAEQQANAEYWDHIDQLRREGEQNVKDEGKHDKK